MNLRPKNTIFFVFILWSFVSKGQDNKFEHYLNLAHDLRNDQFVKAKLYSDSAKILATKKGDTLQLAKALSASCMVLTANARYNAALEENEIADHLAKNYKDQVLLAEIYSNYGILYEKKSEYSKSLNYHHKALAIRQSMGRPKDICISYQNIGALYFYMGENNQSEINTKKALELAEKINDTKIKGELYTNLGAIYFTTYKDSLAQLYMLKALDIAIETNNKLGIENSYNNLSAFYVETDRPLIAKGYLQKALLLLNGNPERATSIMQNMGKVYEKLNKPDSALYYLNKALELAKQIGGKHQVYNAYKDLSNFYFNSSDFKNAYTFQEKFYQLRDSLTNETNLKNAAEIEAIYKTEKQGKEIELLNAENKLQKENSENRKKLLWVSLGAFLLAVFAAVAFYMNFRNKKKDNVILQDKNEEIQKQKDLIAEKNKEIIDSINYAKRLQDAILPPLELIRKQLPNSFVLYKPKDIVAGDFYWMHMISRQETGGSKQSANSLLIAVADCTGHGVPGAMVSVVCANALNAAVKEFGLTEPAKILDKVNELVEETFDKSGNEVRDGMDISLVKIELISSNPDNKLPKGKLIIPKGQSLADVIEASKKYKVQWSGANNPLWYISAGEWKEIDADKQPVGKFVNRKPFTDHIVQLNAGDHLFLFSDGFADQFGGEKGKKIKNKALKDLLYKNSEQAPEHQKQALEKEFDQWKEGYEQVDDVCVIGIKL